MTTKKEKSWSTYRKLMSNLVPALVFVPVFAAGLFLFQQEKLSAAVGFFGASIVIGFFAVNLLGLYQNRKMHTELKPLVHGRQEPSWFVGVGRPGGVGALDPHDDIGFLLLTRDAVEYIGESARYTVPYADIVGVGFKMNAHSLLGLGRWVAIEGKHDGKPFALLVEPRVHPTILQNKKEGARLAGEIRNLIPKR
jgi:hypothetical protein